MFSLLKRLNFTLEAACHLWPAVFSTALSAMKVTNALTQRQKSTQTQISLFPVIRAALFLRTVTVAPGLTTKSLLLLQNHQRIFWVELSAITLGIISCIYKSGANFLCKSPVWSKDANLCHTRGQQVLSSMKHWKRFFLPCHSFTPLLQLTPSYVSASCNVKIKLTLLKFCTEKNLNTFVRGKALSFNWVDSTS